MQGLKLTLILMGLAGLVSAGVTATNSVEEILTNMEKFYVARGDDDLSAMTISQIQALKKRSQGADSCDIKVIANVLSLVDNDHTIGTPDEILKLARQFRNDKFSECSGKYADTFSEEVAQLAPDSREAVEKLHLVVESENNGESLLPVIPSKALKEGTLKFVVQQGNLESLKSKKAYVQEFKDKFASLVIENCENINTHLQQVAQVYEHFIYERHIYEPNSSLLDQIDPATKNWLTNYHICSRLLTDNFLRLNDFVEIAKSKFNGGKWF